MSDCKHEFLEIENNDLFLQCTKCGVWIEINEYPLHEAEQRIKDLERQLEEARELLEEMLDTGYFESSVGLSYIRRIKQLKEKGE